MTKILVDFSQSVISSVAANQKEFRSGDAKDLIKHIALNQLLSLKKRYQGQLILCCDSRSYWRKDEYRWYKGHRKHQKKSGDLDWDMVYETLNELKVELKENFPYILLEIEKAEADDIIAVLVKYFDENELVNTGLIEEPVKIVIASTDQDFQQLQKYSNVTQWNNVTKKEMICRNPKQFLIEHICTGDTGDNIPNVVTGDDWSRDRAENVKTKAKGFATARLAEFYAKGPDACANETELRNWKRNEKLVDFDFIPNSVYHSIVKEYMDYDMLGTKAKVFKYLQDHHMKLLLSNAQDF